MILETLPGWFWTLLYLGIRFLTFRFIVLNIMKPIMKYRETQYRLKVNAGGSSNPLMAYNSAQEMLAASETGIIVQMKDIEKQHSGDPMKDQSYQILQNQRDRITKWRTRLQNPLWNMADQTFFPILKGVVPDVQKAVKRFMKEL